MTELTGKAAIVTGASRGIGAATARALAAAGVSVVLAARGTDDNAAVAQSIRQAGGQAEAMACDVATYSDLERAVEACQTQFGRLDILVNNAGVIEPIGRLSLSNPADWAQAADINYKGVYFGLRAVLPVLQAQGHGVVVNVSSGAAHGPMDGWSHYCSAKAAAAMLTRCADLECRDHGVRITAISPGTVATQMQTSIRASGINPISQLDPSVHADAALPARAIVWLCTDDAAEFAGKEVSLGDPEIRRRAGLDS